MFPAKCLVERFVKRAPAVSLSYRHMRAVWLRGYLKDMYHRRMLLGADPVIHRSAYPNWDYDAEIFAFAHRIGAPETSRGSLIRSLTDESYFQRPDVFADSTGSLPSKDAEIAFDEHNADLIARGTGLLERVLSAYLRYSLPRAPEELIEAVRLEMSSEAVLSKIGTHLGVDVLLRTADFPPSPASIVRSFMALLATLQPKSAQTLILNVVIPNLLTVDFIEAYSLVNPFGVLRDIFRKKGVKNLEPRILRSAGVVSAEPIYIVGIYADKQLLAQSPGESLSIAIDMAARLSLLREWGINRDLRLPLGERAHTVDLSLYETPNYSLREKCNPNTDLSTRKPSGKPAIDIVETSQQYFKQVRAAVGIPLRRRLRHKFSRGSLKKRSFRYFVKPRVYTVS